MVVKRPFRPVANLMHHPLLRVYIPDFTAVKIGLNFVSLAVTVTGGNDNGKIIDSTKN